MLVTMLFALLSQQPATGNVYSHVYGHPGQSRVQKPKRLLRPDGHLFARDESSPFIRHELKGGL